MKTSKSRNKKGAGKGDKYRKVELKKFNETHNNAFGVPKCYVCESNKNVDKINNIFVCDCGWNSEMGFAEIDDLIFLKEFKIYLLPK